MADDFPSPDEIINGGKKPPKPLRIYITDEDGEPARLDEDQQKALSVVLSGMAYIVIGVRPTLGDKGNPGADFITALGGDHEALRDAKTSLPDVIDRLFTRKKIV